MKLGLIRKSFICVLTLSFSLLLASCKNAGKEQTVDGKNVFAQKDILAYAKKNQIKEEFVAPTLKDIDTSKYSVEDYANNALLLRDITTGATKLYTKKSNEIVDLSDDAFTTISTVNMSGVEIDNELYMVYSSSETMLVDNFGNIIISGIQFSGLTVKRLLENKTFVDGENSFYEIINYTSDYNSIQEIYRVDVNMKDGMVISSPTRTKVENSSDIDYSAIGSNNNEEKVSLKDYDLVLSNGSAYVYNTSGKIISSFQTFSFDRATVLDDKLLCQTTTQVSKIENYTYTIGSNYYLLQTYSIDLKTGVRTEIKNYNYLLGDNDINFIYGYNEKKDREYIAAVYKDIYEIVDKRLSITPISGMIDKNGNIISTKIGEAGYRLSYLDDNAYVLYSRGYNSILDAKGNVKGSFVNNGTFRVDYNNKLVFIQESQYNSTGLLLDSNLKVIDFPGRDRIIYYGSFDNGNALVYMNGVNALVKFNGNKMEIIKSYDGTMTSISRIYASEKVGYTCVSAAGVLFDRNIYLVQTMVDTNKINLSVVDANGETLKEYENVTYIYNRNYGGTFLEIIADGTTYYVGTTVYE